MNNKINAVLFDFDGTVADTGRGIFHCVRFAAEFYGLPQKSDEELRTFIGPPLHSSFRNVFGLSEEKSLEAVEKYRELYGTTGMLELDIYGGMEQLLRELKGKKSLCVATSKPDRFIHRILSHLKIDDIFDVVSAPLDKNGDTSKAELITRALRAAEIEKSNAVMVGDRCYDIEGAKQAGVKSIGVTWGYGSEEELINAGADYIVHCVEELKNILE